MKGGIDHFTFQKKWRPPQGLFFISAVSFSVPRLGVAMFRNIPLLITVLLLLIGGYDRSAALSATTDPEAAKTVASSKKILLNDQVALHALRCSFTQIAR